MFLNFRECVGKKTGGSGGLVWEVGLDAPMQSCLISLLSIPPQLFWVSLRGMDITLVTVQLRLPLCNMKLSTNTLWNRENQLPRRSIFEQAGILDGDF